MNQYNIRINVNHLDVIQKSNDNKRRKLSLFDTKKSILCDCLSGLKNHYCSSRYTPDKSAKLIKIKCAVRNKYETNLMIT